MNELDILKLFYDEMVLHSVTREQVFLTLEEEAAELLSKKLGKPVLVSQLQHYADICIANEWVERTTADTNFLKLFSIISNTASTSSHSKRRTNNGRKS